MNINSINNHYIFTKNSNINSNKFIGNKLDEKKETENTKEQFEQIPDYVDAETQIKYLEGKIQEALDNLDFKSALKYQKELQMIQAMLKQEHENLAKTHFEKLTTQA